MKRASLFTVLALLGLLAAAPAVHAAPPTSQFSGHWAGTDPGDGSQLDVFIFGGSHPQLLYTDAVATSACEGASNQSFTSFLTGTVDGDELNSTMRWAKCGTSPRSFQGLTIGWTLDDQGDADASNDVLTNDFEEAFSRVP